MPYHCMSQITEPQDNHLQAAQQPAYYSASCQSGRIVLGIGFNSKAQGEGIEDFICSEMKQYGIIKISYIATLAKGIMPPFFQKLSKFFGNIPLLQYTAAQLEQKTEYLTDAPRQVYRMVGCHGVAEAAALCAAGPQAYLVLKKTVYNNITIALADEKI